MNPLPVEMHSISVLVLAVLAVCALSHPAVETTSQSKTKSPARGDVEFEVDVTVGEVEKGKKMRTVSHPTVKCEHIHIGKGQEFEIDAERDENLVCFSHCVTLGSEYREGKCEGGLCHCEREASPRDYADRVPTVKCSDLVPDGGETRTDNEEACRVHCKTLGGKFGGGKCEGGVCTCRVF